MKTTIPLYLLLLFVMAGSYGDVARLNSYVMIDGTQSDARPIPIKFKNGYGYLIGFDWPDEPFQMPDGQSLYILFKGKLERKEKELVTHPTKPDLAKLKINRVFWEGGEIEPNFNPVADSVYLELRQPGSAPFICSEGGKGKLFPKPDFFSLDFKDLLMTNGSEEKRISLHLEIPYGLKKWHLIREK